MAAFSTQAARDAAGYSARREAPRSAVRSGGALVPADEIARLKREWDELAAQSLETNPAYAWPEVTRTNAPDCLVAHHDGVLIGAMPIMPAARRFPLLSRPSRAWGHGSGTPLLHRGSPDAAADMLVEAARNTGQQDWVIPNVAMRGPAVHCLTSALTKRAVPYGFANVTPCGSGAATDLGDLILSFGKRPLLRLVALQLGR